jgi:predicted RNase H-like HicB family nuclease
MQLKVVVHETEEGGFWAEVPSIAGCATQGETMQALMENLHDAIELRLSVDLEEIPILKNDRIVEIPV